MIPGLLNCDLEGMWITFGSTPGADPDGRWCFYDLTDLETDREVIGENDRVVGFEGRIPNPLHFDQTRFLLPLAVTGHVSSTGSYLGPTGSDDRMWQALNVLRAALVPTAGQTGVKTVTFKPYASASPWTAPFQIIRLNKHSAEGGVWDGDLEVLQLESWS